MVKTKITQQQKLKSLLSSGPKESFGQVEVNVEAVDKGVGKGGGDGVQLPHQVEGDDDLRVLNLVLHHDHTR